MTKAIDNQIIKDVMGWPIRDIEKADVDTESYPFAFWDKQSKSYAVFYKDDEDAETFTPSKDIAAAWQVVEKLRQSGWLVVVKEMPDGFPFLAGNDWTRDPKIKARAVCELSWMSIDTPEDSHKRIFKRPTAWADSVTEAICKAALQAIE